MDKFSKYLKKKKPLVKKLIEKLAEEYEFVSVLGTDVKGKVYYVDKSSVAISSSSITECGFVLRVFYKGVYSEYSFSELEEKNIDKIIDEIRTLVNENITINKVNAKPIQEEELVKKFRRKDNSVVHSPEELTTLLKDYSDYGMQLNDKVINVKVGFESNEVSKMYLSTKRDLEQYYTWNNSHCFALVRDGQNMKYYYNMDGYAKVDEALDSFKGMIDDTVKVALELLEATLPVPGVYTIITDPSITGLIAHEAFGHGLEMDMFVKDRAKSQEYMNKEVASKLITMHDGASATLSAASYFFDDEGVLAQDTVIINKGILVGGICDSVSASILNYHPTGNGRRESYKRKVYTRMTNTFFEKGKTKLEDMIKSVDYGYYIAQTNNGMEDPKNWGIQCTAVFGREIKNGAFTGKVISPVVMSGYVIDLLESISMVSNDFKIEGAGSCGKGYKEWVRVSDGGGCIKAQVKIG